MNYSFSLFLSSISGHAWMHLDSFSQPLMAATLQTLMKNLVKCNQLLPGASTNTPMYLPFQKERTSKEAWEHFWQNHHSNSFKEDEKLKCSSASLIEPPQ